MTDFQIAAGLVVIAALLSYLNYTVLKFPPAIGLMALSLAGSVVLVVVGWFVPAVERQAKQLVEHINLGETLLHGMLGFLLFAGALHIKFEELSARKWTVLVLSTVGVVISTAVVGLVGWCAFDLAGVPVRLIDCLIFGALISPTDPIAVMAILRQAGVPQEMEIKIAGESLFNDGIGVVVFLGLLGIAQGGPVDTLRLVELFLWEAVGGALFGFALGWVTYRMLRSVDHYQVEILLSLALVAGGYALADALHTSGPIAMVVAGLLIGNTGRSYAMSRVTVEHLNTFWELIDEVLNSVLFVLIGLEVLALDLNWRLVAVGLFAIPVVLFARLVSVAAPVAALRWKAHFAHHTIRILTWGGLRGGISVALALSVPRPIKGAIPGERDAMVVVTYVVVVFSILVQGLTIGPLARRWLARQNQVAPAPPADAKK